MLGFLDKVEKHLSKNNIKYQVVKQYNLPIQNPKKPYLKDIVFREYQSDQIKAGIKKQRGVIVSATASGKTVLQAGIISCFPDSKILLLCDTVDIINQTNSEFQKWGFDSYVINTGKDKKWLTKNLVLSTIQTAVNLSSEDYMDYFDIILIDETHKVSSETGRYGTFLNSSLAPMRLGFTATLPRTTKQKLALEGLLGPVINEYTVQKGVKEGYLSEPILKLLNVPYIANSWNYQETYEYGIVENKSRNKLIVNSVKKNIRQKKSTLIMIQKIKHGEILDSLFKAKKIKGIEFIQGKTDKSGRLEVKQALENKEIKCVICTAIWREGINIKSLDCIVNAAGGKSEVAVVQIAGRGLRRTNDKKEVQIIDFLDPYKWLAQHSVLRLQTYNKNGWI